MNHILFRLALVFALLASPIPRLAMAETPPPPTFTVEQLDQLTAPIALYPDNLLSQILMAATYPSDVADAAAWSKKNPKQQGDAAVKAVDSEPWDPSVKSLVAFPQVLSMMAEKPDWVQNLGDAFLASSKDVLDSVQRLRAKAKEAGNLKSNEQQKVTVQQQTAPAPAPAPQQPPPPPPPPQQIIVIESTNPQVVYVPAYNPTVVYGTWPYPAYPPYYYPPPPAYYPGTALASGLAFGVGVGITAALWSDCDWNNGDVDVNVNRSNNISGNTRVNANGNKFQHNAANRRGVPYRDTRSQQKFGRNQSGAGARNDYRGRDPGRDSRRQQAQSTLQDRGMDPSRGRDQLRNDPKAREQAQNAARGSNNRDNRGGDRGQSSGFGNDRGGGRDSSPGFDRGQASTSRAGTSRARGNSDNAFSGAGNTQRTRQEVDRGSASRQQASQRSGGGGGMRSGGGGGGRSGGGGGRRR